MITRLNIVALEEYSKRYAKQICDTFFAQNSVVNNEALFEITPIPQINLFLVREMYDKWRTEMETFRSPYFDFENEDMRELLGHYINLASQHIAVKRPVFEPMLESVVSKTLRLSCVPQDYFNDLFKAQPSLLVSKVVLDDLHRYTNINRFLVEGVIQKMGDNDSIYATQAIETVEELLMDNPNGIPPLETVLLMFSTTLPIEEKDILKRLPRPTASFFDSAAEVINALAAKRQAEETVAPIAAPVLDAEPAIVPSLSLSQVPAALAPEPVQVAPVTEPEPVKEAPAPEVVVAEKAGDNGAPTVKDVLAKMTQDSAPTTAERASDEEGPLPQVTEILVQSKANKPRLQPLASIAQGVPLHQKFLFIQELFGGSPSQYEQVVSELDKAGNYDAAREMLNFKFASKFLWDMSSDTVAELAELVKRRYEA